MMLATRARLTFLITAIAAAVTVAAAQQPAIPPNVLAAKLGDVVPVDPLITVGTLPERPALLRPREQAAAGARRAAARGQCRVRCSKTKTSGGWRISSSTWRSTARCTFPKQDIVSFMQSLGMRFGAHVNAHTSFDETVYELQIPTDNPAVIDRSLLILEDWAHNVTFDPAEIDKERGVILEEWRLGLGAGRAHAGHAIPDAAEGLALRRAAADRQAGDHPQRQATIG